MAWPYVHFLVKQLSPCTGTCIYYIPGEADEDGMCTYRAKEPTTKRQQEIIIKVITIEFELCEINQDPQLKEGNIKNIAEIISCTHFTY